MFIFCNITEKVGPLFYLCTLFGKEKNKEARKKKGYSVKEAAIYQHSLSLNAFCLTLITLTSSS